MADEVKLVDDLVIDDFQRSPVWEFTNEDEEDLDETAVRPVRPLPVADLGNRICGTQVVLANGQRIWAIIGNVDVVDPRKTEQFLGISLEKNGHWFHVASYSAFNFAEMGPDRAAEFLGLSVDEVFPIAYDIREFAEGNSGSLRGEIPKEPRERLTLEERFALTFPE